MKITMRNRKWFITIVAALYIIFAIAKIIFKVPASSLATTVINYGLLIMAISVLFIGRKRSQEEEENKEQEESEEENKSNL